MRNFIRSLAAASVLFLTLCGAAKTAHAQTDLGPPDLAVMQSLRDDYRWGAAFGWGNSNPCPSVGGNWNGVTCNNGRVVQIVAICSNVLLSQPIPTILPQLTGLTSLDLRSCGMYGPIPDGMQNMTILTRLRLDGNALTGEIPSAFTNFPSLGTFELAANRMTGPIPHFPDNSAMIIGLDGNFFTELSPNWTVFNRSLKYNCIPSLPPTCDSQSTRNQCTPQRAACPSAVIVSKVSGDGQRTQINTSFANPLAVSVTDLSNNPISGATVTFSGPGIVTAIANTDGNGIASASITANGTVGGNSVTASVSAAGMVTFGLTAGSAAACSGNISVTSTADSGPGTLREALADVCPGGTVDLTAVAGQTIGLSASATSYNFSGRLYIGDDVTILGHGATISGSGNTRIFFVEGGNVTLQNLMLTDGLGQGGTSQYGGSAAGMGGAIFQNGGTLTLSSVTLSSNTAKGGSPDTSGNTAGGGFGANSTGGDLGGASGPGDGAGGIVDGAGGPGGFGAGGGEGNAPLAAHAGPPGGLGGYGGFGGGGGWAASYTVGNNFSQGVSGLPGFGGGSDYAGNGSGLGGGGAGFGGAIFTRAGTLNLNGVSFSGNSAMAGTGGGISPQAKGGSLFIYNGASLNMDNATTFSGSVAGAAGAAGVGYSDDPYNPGQTCPGRDDADVCGVVSNYALSGPATAAYNTSFQVSTSANNTATATLLVIAGPCSISGNTVSVSGAAGTCVVQASWAANTPYPAGTARLKVAITPSGSSCQAPPANLTAWYKGENNASDVTGEYNGTASGNSYASGYVGQAFSFSSSQTNPYVSIPQGVFPSNAMGPFTFEAWFNTFSGGVILGHQDSAPYGSDNNHVPAIYVDISGVLRVQMFYNSSVSNQAVSSYGVNDGKWHHVAVTLDASNSQITYLGRRGDREPDIAGESAGRFELQLANRRRRYKVLAEREQQLVHVQRPDR